MKTIILLLLVVCLTKTRAVIDLNYQTIEDSCTLQMTQGYAYKNINLGLLRYQQQCKNMEEYTSCVWRMRQMWDVININIPIYDRYFPKIDDLRFAGFVFCKAYLPILFQLFPPSVDMSSCSVPLDQCRREFVKDEEVKSLKEAVNNRNVEKAQFVSCRIMAPFTNCIREGYLKCSPNYRLIFDYEMAKMGGKCLSLMNLTAPLVAMSQCDPRYSPPDSGRGFVTDGSQTLFPLAALVTFLMQILILVNIQ
ncbi:hypothetical protein Bpfe_010589 [Biomphalaria pfeifferi]|uniref:FZ domain-containing protein n=1 Tax=Biomphalaria pfeifferi TaxID=112525 RepID=A0AAD8BSZ4_BIOPF|nr:hypothetical protein Bpfe_010589 [Biomphalaria pfeifferi]